MEDKWHPLYDTVPYDSRHDRGDIALCGELIKKARELWERPLYESPYPKWKLVAAQYLYDNCLETNDVFSEHFPFYRDTIQEGICELLEQRPDIDWMCLFLPPEKRKNLDRRIDCIRMISILVIRHALRALKDFFRRLEYDQDITKEIRTAKTFVKEIQIADTFMTKEIRIVKTFVDDIRIAEAFMIWIEARLANKSTIKQTDNTVSTSQNKPESERQSKDNVFRWCGGTWEITYDGKTIRPPDSKGLKYIQYLIHKEGQEIYASELIKITITTNSEESKQKLMQKSIQIGEDELNECVKEGVPPKQLKKGLNKLREKLQEAESEEEREDIQRKIDKITMNIENIQGEGSAESARTAVFNAINRALDNIKKDHPALYKYLKASLTTGTSNKYESSIKIQWTTE